MIWQPWRELSTACVFDEVHLSLTNRTEEQYCVLVWHSKVSSISFGHAQHARISAHADVAQLVERQLPKLEVAGSKPVVRSVLAFQLVSLCPEALADLLTRREALC